jgi:hypothetical protein
MMSFAGLLFSATQIRIVIEEDGQLLPYTAIIKNESAQYSCLCIYHIW